MSITPPRRVVATRTSRPPLTLVPTGPDHPRPEERACDDRIAAAALQATAQELSALAASAQCVAGALLGGTPVADATADTALRTIPRWHFAMLNDSDRNDAFELALSRRVHPGSHVLDIGSGTGLLAMMAVRAGAGRVTTCEANPLLAEIARHVIAAHGMSDVIAVVSALSTELEIGRNLSAPADLIVSEIVDCGLIGEGLLPTIRHARAHLLAPGGALLPESARLMACLVESEAIAQLNRVTTAAGYDVRLLNRFATAGHFPVRLNTWPHRLLSEPLELLQFDLEDDSLQDGRRIVELVAAEAGTVHGLIAWFELDLGAGVVVRNSPQEVSTHWMQAFLPWPEPVSVTHDESLSIELRWHEQRLSADYA
jgi:predicted RNA methylase